MQNRVQKMLKRFFADKLKRRRLTAVVSALSVLVVVGVFLQLMQPVITMTPDPDCGKEAHAHGDACYEQLLTCTSAEEGHVHGEACYANTLTCGKEAHEHVDACYPETVEEPTVPPTEEPTAVVTEAPAATGEPEESEAPSETDGSAAISAQTEEGDEEVQPTEEAAGEVTTEPTEEAAGEATAEPTEEATGEATAEPTEEATGEATAEPTEEATGEATTEPTEEVTGEANAEPTVEATGEANAEPTVEATAEPTEEPTAEPTEEVVVPLTLEGLTVDRAAAKVGEAITWQFSVAGAEKIEYVIVDEAGSVMAGSELTANYISWTASHAGKYTIIVTAYAGEDVASVSGEVTAQDTAELTASVWSDALYCFAGQDVTFNLAKSGETEITACEITVVQNGKVLDSRTEFAETVTVTTEAQSDVTDVTLTLTLTDAAGAVVTAAHTIPCPVKVVETEAEWKQAADIGELSGVWADDLLAIAKKQIGYFESDVNFIINEEGRHGYTRYGDWYGQPYREWCAMFLSYCLEYAEVPEEYIPRHASSSDWMDELRYLDLFSYRTAEDCEPAAGDLIFFDWNEDGVPEHIGMVSEVTETLVHTIEGNAEAAVRAREYAKGDKQILGYGLITKAYEQYVEDITPDEDMTSVSGRTGVITASKANLRAAADASSERIDTLTEGAAVSILSAEQNEDGFWWYQLAAGELTGYVRSDLVALDEVVPTAEPTAEPTPEPTPEPTAEPTPAPTEEPVDPNTLYGSLMLQIRALTAPEQPAANADEETLAAYQAAQAQYEASRAALNERILTSYASTDLTDEEYRKLDAALTGAPEPTAEPTPEATFAPTLEPTAEPTPTPAPNPVQVSMEIEVVDEEAETANIIMTAALTGISAEDYLWQWQVSATGEEPWENIEGATELTLTIPLSEESYNAFYRIYGDYIEPAEAAEPQVTAEPTAPAEQAAAYGMRTMSLSMDEQPSAGEDAAAAETAGIALAEETSGAQTFAITTGGDVASDANTPAVASINGNNGSYTVDVVLYAVDSEGTPITSIAPVSGSTTITSTLTNSTDSDTDRFYVDAIYDAVAQQEGVNGTCISGEAYLGTEAGEESYSNVTSLDIYMQYRRGSRTYSLRYNGEETNISNAGQLSLYIPYTPNSYKVQFVDNAEGSQNVAEPIEVNYNETVPEGSVPDWKRDGYVLQGWTIGEYDPETNSKIWTDDEILTEPVTGDVTYMAKWAKEIEVTLDSNCESITDVTIKVAEGSTLTIADEPAWIREDGNVLAGWLVNNEVKTWAEICAIEITEATTFAANWGPGYNVTFKDEDNEVTYGVLKDATLPESKIPAWVTADGRVIDGWTDSEGKVWSNAEIAQTAFNTNTTLAPKWVQGVKVSVVDAEAIYGDDAMPVFAAKSGESITVTVKAAATPYVWAIRTATTEDDDNESVAVLTGGTTNEDGTVTYVIENISQDMEIYPYQTMWVTYDPELTLERISDSDLAFGETGWQEPKEYPTMHGSEEVYYDAVIMDENGKYVVQAPDQEYVSVVITHETDHTGTIYFYTFSHWVIEGTSETLTPGTVLTEEQIRNYAGTDGTLSLTAKWTARYVGEDATTEDIWATVNFYVNLTSTITDSDGNVNSNDQSLFTPSLYASRVLGLSQTNVHNAPTKNTTDPDYQYLNVYVSSNTLIADKDDEIRTLAYQPADCGIYLESFPADEIIYDGIRDYLEKNQSKSVTVDDTVYSYGEGNIDEINSTNFVIRWHVFKHERDGWHIDGVLVPKQGKLTITKTFYGDADMISYVKGEKSDANGKINNYQVTVTEKGENSPAHTLTLENASVSGNTYAWTVNVKQNTEYVVEEENYLHFEGENVTAAEYSIINSPTGNTSWKTYTDSGVNATAIAYPDDVSSSQYQTVRLLNSYVPENTMLVRKIDEKTGNSIAGIKFKLTNESTSEVVSPLYYYISNPYRFYTYTPPEDGGTIETITDGILTGDNQGGFMISWAETDTWLDETYKLEELNVPEGYLTNQTDVTFTVDSDGEITNITGNATLSDTNVVAINIENTPNTTQVIARKDWGSAADDEKKPVVLALRLNGGEMGSDYTITLDGVVDDKGEFNAWEYTWNDIPLYVDGKLANYTLDELRIGDEQYDSRADTDGYENYLVNKLGIVYYEDAERQHKIEEAPYTNATTAVLEIENTLLSGKVSFKKVDKAGVGLQGAEFTIYSDEDCTDVVKTVTSDASGTVAMELKSGVYYMKETKSPTNYEENNKLYRLIVTGQSRLMIYEKISDHPNEDTNTKYTYSTSTLSNILNTISIATVNVKKVDQAGEALAGAVFELRKLGTNVYGVVSNAGFTGTDDPESEWVLKDLSSGKYQIVETMAPAGYYRMTTKVEFEIAAGEVIVLDSAGEKVTAKTELNDAVTYDPETNTFNIKNHTGSELPSTGGAGTLPYTLGGLLMMAVSLVYGLGLKRRRERGTAK